MNTLEPVVASLRIGDEERQQAIAVLGEHWAAGRLTADEFDERTNQVLTARTAQNLALVFQDLPGKQTARRPILTGLAASERGRLLLAATSSAAVASFVGFVVGIGAANDHAHAIIRHLLQLLPVG